MAFKFFNLAVNEIIDTSSLKKLCNINKEISAISLADMYSDVLDTKKASQIYKKLVDKGSLIALNTVFQWIIKSALAGTVDPMYNVGCFYKNGKDDKEAFKWYLKAAEKEYPLGQYNVRYCYKNGYGIDRDEVKAFEWDKKAADNDYTNGQYMIGLCFYEGWEIL
ncbi:hypothetical protein Glove_300g120 [Diversispora epigaea]|uniref:HCP-like protein n=1 Tax=Diversispora epigaea TaxID=1348612 RepID=A0A397I2G4_9GLOM|nr:hypothetical protein Glove_300g120 [Diversispora epigaea]